MAAAKPAVLLRSDPRVMLMKQVVHVKYEVRSAPPKLSAVFLRCGPGRHGDGHIGQRTKHGSCMRVGVGAESHPHFLHKHALPRPTAARSVALHPSRPYNKGGGRERPGKHLLCARARTPLTSRNQCQLS